MFQEELRHQFGGNSELDGVLSACILYRPFGIHDR
jgi:hypothetical protein